MDEKRDFSVFPFRGIVIEAVAKGKSVGGTWRLNGRRNHGISIKISGLTECRLGDQVRMLEAGKAVFFSKSDQPYILTEREYGPAYVINFSSEPNGQPPFLETLHFPARVDVVAAAAKRYEAWTNPSQSARLAVTASFYSLLAKAAEAYEKPFDLSPREMKLLLATQEYLRERLFDPQLRVEELPEHIGVSEVYLRRLFKKHGDPSPAAFVTQLRMQAAKELLESEELSVSETARAVGYEDPLYFCRLFKKHSGYSPTEYIKQIRQNVF